MSLNSTSNKLQTHRYLSFQGLPKLMADESFYSWCARYHYLASSQTKQTNQILFGHSLAGLHHDIPANLKYFLDKTLDFIGTGEEIIENHTVFNFHARFLPSQTRTLFIKLLLDGQYGKVYPKLVQKKNTLSFHYQLKRCDLCIEEDLKNHHYAWWRVSHQLPSSFYCSIHQSRLQAFTLPKKQGIADNFYIATSNNLKTALEIEEKYADKFKKISEVGNLIWKGDNLEFSEDILRWCYRYQALALGYTTFDGLVRTFDLRNDFVSYYGDAVQYFGDKFIYDLKDVNCGFIPTLFRNVHGRRHPLKHILLICFMFENFDTFLNLYRIVVADMRIGAQVCEDKMRVNQKSLINLVKNEGMSLNKSTKILDIAITTAAKFLDKQKIVREKRTRIKNSSTEVELKSMLIKGVKRNEISSKLNLTKRFIRDYLESNLNLKKQWEVANHKKLIKIHRKMLLSILKKDPTLSIDAIRRHPNNGYRWLYKHDFNWLTQNLPSLWKRN